MKTRDQGEREARLDSLVAACLAARDGGDPEAVDRLYDENPDLAADLRRRVDRIAVAGLLGDRKRPEVSGFTVVEPIGEGGMGEVWRARQQGALRREVALKVIRTGHARSDQVLARFESERQALALMSHPGIAQVFEAGTTETGAPFFAMELIEGRPITDYCDHRRLHVSGRLELFLEVCRAVHHAHQRGVLHRDLKPANLLVTEVEGRPQPKVIDFGLAKALDQRLAERTLATEMGQLLGTPEYMSPEQAELSEAGVDTRTDIYSLGVVLYELLTGVLPFDPHRMRKEGILELLRVIREDEPPRPSSRVAALGALAEPLAEARSTDSQKLVRDLRGDLDWILAWALAKDREQRYATALDLARDVERHLQSRPVAAGPPTTRYLLRKFVRRNRVALAVASVILVTLIASLATVTAFFLDSQRSLSYFDWLAKVDRSQELLEEADRDLWPMIPERIPALTKWLDEVEPLVEERGEVLAVLSEIRRQAPRPDAVTATARYDEHHRVILDQQLERLGAHLAMLVERMPDVRLRRDWAADLQRLSIDSPRERWDEAIASIADPEQCPLYEGLVIRPQLGLLPLRRNEQGLWEFAVLHPRMTLPEADPDPDATSYWRIEPDTCVVLVLVPGKRFPMGAQNDRPGRPMYDDLAMGDECPPWNVNLVPYFLSKYELTQGQWMLIHDGHNPSHFSAEYEASDLAFEDHSLGPTNPVERVGWHDSTLGLLRLGLTLPTEARWEFAARGGTLGRWIVCDQIACLGDYANLRDLTCKRRQYLHAHEEEVDDGWMLHAPVGSFLPNPYGLHDVMGNVCEWAVEPPVSYWRDPRDGDGLIPHDPTDSRRVARGGSFESPAAHVRVTYRLAMPLTPNATVGLRPARALDP